MIRSQIQNKTFKEEEKKNELVTLQQYSNIYGVIRSHRAELQLVCFSLVRFYNDTKPWQSYFPSHRTKHGVGTCGYTVLGNRTTGRCA